MDIVKISFERNNRLFKALSDQEQNVIQDAVCKKMREAVAVFGNEDGILQYVSTTTNEGYYSDIIMRVR